LVTIPNKPKKLHRPLPEGDDSIFAKKDLYQLPAFRTSFVQKPNKDFHLALRHLVNTALAFRRAEIGELAEFFNRMLGNFILEKAHKVNPSRSRQVTISSKSHGAHSTFMSSFDPRTLRRTYTLRASGKLFQKSIGSPGPNSSGFAFKSALGEINRLLAACTNMFPIELIGKNLFFLATIRALTYKGFQVLEILHARAMQGCRHGFSPFLWACFSEEPHFLSQQQAYVKAFPWRGDRRSLRGQPLSPGKSKKMN